MLDAGRQEEGPQRDLDARSRRNDWSGMEDKRLRYNHMRTAAETGIARGLGLIGMLVLSGNLGRDIALIRLEQVAGEYLHRHKEQHKHRCELKQLG